LGEGKPSSITSYRIWRRVHPRILRLFLSSEKLFNEMASITLNRVSENLIAAGVSRAVLATICDVKPPTLSAAYKGTASIGSVKEAELLSASHRLLDLRAALQPLSLPEDATALRVLVNRLQDGVLSEETIRAAVQVLFQNQ
jgi:hypothetical protein